VRLWESTEGAVQALLPHRGLRGNRTSLTFSPTGQVLAVGQDNGRVVLWEAVTWTPRGFLWGHTGWLTSLTFTADGRTLATADTKRRVKLWDVATGEEWASFVGHTDAVLAVALSPDGRTLASAGMDKTVRLWDVPTRGPKGVGARKLAAPELPKIWDALAAPEASQAYPALGALAGAPEQAVALLRERLPPVAPFGRSFHRWLADLDDDDFGVRERATAGIARLGRLAGPALREVLRGNPAPEVRRRVEDLLGRLGENGLSPEEVRAARAVEVLEYVATLQARELLRRLAEGEPKALLTQEARASLRRLGGR
jgi:hypothetical protein